MRRRDRHQPAVLRGWNGAIHIARQGLAEGIGFGRVGAAGVGGLAHRLGGELAPALPLHAREILVFEETRSAQRLHQASGDFAHVEIAGQPHQHGSQIEIRFFSVEACQRFHQQRWNDEYRVGEVVPIADQQPGVLLGRRWHEIEIET